MKTAVKYRDIKGREEKTSNRRSNNMINFEYRRDIVRDGRRDINLHRAGMLYKDAI